MSENPMPLFPTNTKRYLIAPALLAALCGFPATGLGQQKTFATASEAASALVAAAKSDDVAALNEILGPEAKELISSGDDVADKSDRETFVKDYEQQHRLVASGPGKLSLKVGTQGHTLPIPLVKTGDHWTFDAAAGKQEILYERVGQNELDSVRVLKAIIQAEHEYKAAAHDGNAAGVYTRKLRSDAGKQNGLYWETTESEPTSPGGPLLAEASSDGYESGPGRHQPFHGYLYHLLGSQGSHATGGARDYTVDGKMTRGFAVVAYPVEYGASGVMTFIVNQHGVVYEKDLGENTKEQARAMSTFDPDSSWKVVR
jgi:hypothetical protein